MKTKLLFSLFLTLAIFQIEAQVLNEPANWPNTNWTLSGSYHTTFLYENPTITGGSTSFSFDDDDAGGGSVNNVAVESPVINLTHAFNADEKELIVTFNYSFNIYQNESLHIQYWKNSENQWINWQNNLDNNSNANSNYCADVTSFSSNNLSISNFNTSDLENFKYRIFYNDNNSFGWGFCVNNLSIYSSATISCTSVSNLSVSNVNTNSAQIYWNAGGSETSWETAIQLASQGQPSSGNPTTSNSAIFSNLIPNTQYTVSVRANCNADGYSLWTSQNFTTGENIPGMPISFTTNSIETSGSFDLAMVDMNGDYLDDIVSVNSTSINIHYQQASGGLRSETFTTTSADFNPSWSMAAGDFDGNGYNDLLYGGGSGVTFMKANNDGTAYTETSGSQYVFSQRSNFIDINNDGNLDAFVCHDVQANVYYLNDGSGNLTFYQGQSTELPNGLGLVPGGGNYATVWIDYDNDRDMDMFIAKCRGGSTTISTNELWRNDGNGVFINVADSNNWYNDNYPGVGHNNSSNLGDNVQTWSSAWADFDNDGDMDVYVGASNNSNGDSKLMRNNGDGTFTDITAGSGVLNAAMGIENAPADFDNDGYVDIISNGNILFNNGDFTFTNYANNVPQNGALGDINNDGFIDVYRSNNVYINNANSNNWIKINTIGTLSNLNGIGARVELHTSTGTQIRDVRSGEGFRYMSTLNTHFGLGSQTTIDSVVIYWPSGIIDTVTNPNINEALTVIEGNTLSLEDETLVNTTIYPNPVKDVLHIKTTQNIIGKIATVFDINGKRVQNEKLTTNSLSVSKLSNGVYFLRLEKNGKSITRKFIKK